MHCLRTTVDYLDAIIPVKITRSILIIQWMYWHFQKSFRNRELVATELVMHKDFAKAWPLLFMQFFYELHG
jgi:hypothetical protein